MFFTIRASLLLSGEVGSATSAPDECRCLFVFFLLLMRFVFETYSCTLGAFRVEGGKWRTGSQRCLHKEPLRFISLRVFTDKHHFYLFYHLKEPVALRLISCFSVSWTSFSVFRDLTMNQRRRPSATEDKCPVNRLQRSMRCHIFSYLALIFSTLTTALFPNTLLNTLLNVLLNLLLSVIHNPFFCLTELDYLSLWVQQ